MDGDVDLMFNEDAVLEISTNGKQADIQNGHAAFCSSDLSQRWGVVSGRVKTKHTSR